MSDFEIGDLVTVNSPGHRRHGQAGPVTYYGKFTGTWGVQFDGHDYGFFAGELVKVAA